VAGSNGYFRREIFILGGEGLPGKVVGVGFGAKRRKSFYFLEFRPSWFLAVSAPAALFIRRNARCQCSQHSCTGASLCFLLPELFVPPRRKMRIRITNPQHPIWNE